MQSPQRLQPANLRGALKLNGHSELVHVTLMGIYTLILIGFWLLSVIRKGTPFSQDIFQRGLTTRSWQDSRKFREKSFNPEEFLGNFYILSSCMSLICSLKVAAEFLVHSYQYVLCLDCELWLLCYYVYSENIPPYLKVSSLCQT